MKRKLPGTKIMDRNHLLLIQFLHLYPMLMMYMLQILIGMEIWMLLELPITAIRSFGLKIMGRKVLPAILLQQLRMEQLLYM